MRTYAEASGRHWVILPAEHGLARPDDWLEPYERYLPDTAREYRRMWGDKVAKQLEHAVRPTHIDAAVHALADQRHTLPRKPVKRPADPLRAGAGDLGRVEQ